MIKFDKVTDKVMIKFDKVNDKVMIKFMIKYLISSYLISNDKVN